MAWNMLLWSSFFYTNNEIYTLIITYKLLALLIGYMVNKYNTMLKKKAILTPCLVSDNVINFEYGFPVNWLNDTVIYVQPKAH